MTGTDPEETLRQLAAESLAADDPTGWFERAYAAGEDGTAVVPWDLRTPHRLLVVQYLAADLLDPPSDWREAFDLVVESNTVQALPERARRDAIVQVGHLVASGGTLIVIAAAREEEDGPVEGPPWPLTRAEIESFGVDHLQPVLIEDIRDVPEPGDRRWRAEFRRPRP